MKTLYFRETKGLEEVENISLVENDSKEIDTRVNFEKKSYEVMKCLPYVKSKKDYDRKKHEIIGYVRAYKNEDKAVKAKAAYSIDEMVAVREKKLPTEKVIGYIKTNKELYDADYYIAVTVPRNFIPLIILIALVLLVFGLRSCDTDQADNTTVVDNKPKQEVVFKDGDKGKGELETEKTEFAAQQTFRMRLNCTPTVEDGQINLRLESPAEENKDFGFVVKVYLLQKVDKDTVIEDYTDEDMMIYESPIIYADENIETAPLDIDVESGNYIARAIYDIYDLDNNFLGQTACRLDLSVN